MSATTELLVLLSFLLVVAVHRQKFASGDKVTSFGKEYLCNTCLSKESTAVMELRISATESDDDDDDNTSTQYKMQYSSVSAPATPAKHDLSASTTTARTASTTDADSSLDLLSSRSLLDVNTDGLSTACIHPLFFGDAESKVHGSHRQKNI